MKPQNYKPGRRVRMFAGPNGSGKSTVYAQIGFRFDVGYYVNADDLLLELTSQSGLSLEKFDLNEKEFLWEVLHPEEHSFFKKAVGQGRGFQIFHENGFLRCEKNLPENAYAAAFIAQKLRERFLEKGKKFFL